MMKTSLKRLYELDRTYATFGNRLDGSGIRVQGLKRPPHQRDKVYPYDKEPEYGQPQKYKYGPSQSDGSRDHGRPLIPKDVSHTHWDDEDELDEVTGYPMLVIRSAGEGGQGGGRTIPGTGGDWAATPKKPWDDNTISDEELEQYGESIVPMTNRWSNPYRPPNDPERGMTDDDLKLGTKIPDADDVVLRVATAAFSMSPGQANKISRMAPGQTWKESKDPWKMAEAYVSLRHVPVEKKQDGVSVAEDQLLVLKDEFRKDAFEAFKRLRVLPEGQMLFVLFEIDPDFVSEKLAKIGKEGLVSIYRDWVKYVSESDENVLRKATASLQRRFK